jgi:cytoskeletal protein RodZ
MLTQFKTKQVNTSITVGERLKKKRIEMEISIREVSEKLKVKADYISDLEENNYDKLPPDVYVKGFIKSYAALIGLDAQEMVDLYNKERAIGEKNENKKQFKKKTEKRKFSISRYIIITPKILTIFSTLIILSIAGYYLFHQLSSFNSTPYLFVSNPIGDQSQDKSEIEVRGQTEKEASLKINGEDVFVDSDGNFKQIIILKPGNNVLNIEAANKFNKTAELTRNIIYEKKLESFEFKAEDNAGEVNGASVKDGNYAEESLKFDGKIEFIGP